MDYEKKYKELVDAIKVLQDNNPSDEGIQNWINDNVPELQESEDEKIIKWLIYDIKTALDEEDYKNEAYKQEAVKALAWLEKQGETTVKKGKKYRCTKTHRYAGLDWIEGTIYFASDDYTLVNQGCDCFCPKYDKGEHNNLFDYA